MKNTTTNTINTKNTTCMTTTDLKTDPINTEPNNYHYWYGGEITIDDFSTAVPNKNRIDSFVEADEFNKIQAERRIYMGLTLEELKELKLLSNTDGRPREGLTDQSWQNEFMILRTITIPSLKSSMGGKYAKESNKWNEEIWGQYCGMTNYQEYCAFINDVLRTIRSGQVDYCYFIYQITDLLKFHKDTLQTKYCDGYWEVWLKR